jgi:hypothetical protein
MTCTETGVEVGVGFGTGSGAPQAVRKKNRLVKKTTFFIAFPSSRILADY